MMSISTATVQMWLSIAGFILIWGSTIIAFTRRNATRDTQNDAKMDAIKKDIDAVGSRVNFSHEELARHGEAIGTLRLEQQGSRDDRGAMREKIAANSTSLRTLQEEIQEERITVITMLHNSEKTAAERDTTLRVELAALRERMNIEQIVISVMRNSGPNGVTT